MKPSLKCVLFETQAVAIISRIFKINVTLSVLILLLLEFILMKIILKYITVI